VCAGGNGAVHSGGGLRGASVKGQGENGLPNGGKGECGKEGLWETPRDSIKNQVSAGVVLG
jgi:hypothetical protein